MAVASSSSQEAFHTQLGVSVFLSGHLPPHYPIQLTIATVIRKDIQIKLSL